MTIETDVPRVVVRGTVRLDRRTKQLVRRLQPGDIAVIDHPDLDRIAAEELVAARVGAVVNAAKSITGRYTNAGPAILMASGIPLVDDVGDDVFDDLTEGQIIEVVGGSLRSGQTEVAKGDLVTTALLAEQLDVARSQMGVAVEQFAENTLDYLRKEWPTFTSEIVLPPLKTKFQGRQVLVVVRGNDYRADLSHLRSYIREMRPILIGVDRGADALLELGLKPDLIVGDFDSVSDEALHCGAELVVHAYPDGNAPGADRLTQLGVQFVRFPFSGTSEDVAMLLAHESGAELIVAVGTHATMTEFLDKGRAGMASTFLVRLRIGSSLVDAKGVSRLYQARVRKRDLLFFLSAVLCCFIAIIMVAYPLRVFARAAWLVVRHGL